MQTSAFEYRNDDVLDLAILATSRFLAVRLPRLLVVP